MKHSKHRMHELKSWARPVRNPAPEAERDEVERPEHHSIADVSWHVRHTLMTPWTALKVPPTRPSDYSADIITRIVDPPTSTKVVTPNRDTGTDILVDGQPYVPPGTLDIVVTIADAVTPTKVVPPHRDMGTDIFVDGQPYVPPGTTDFVVTIADPATPTKIAPPQSDTGTDILVDGQPYVPPGTTDVVVTILGPATSTKVVPPQRDMGTDVFVDGQPYVPPGTTDIITSVADPMVTTQNTSPIVTEAVSPASTGQTLICIYEPRPTQKGGTQPLHFTETKGPDQKVHNVIADLVQALIHTFEPRVTSKFDTIEFADNYGADNLLQDSDEGAALGHVAGEGTEVPGEAGVNWTRADGWRFAFDNGLGVEDGLTDYFHFA